MTEHRLFECDRCSWQARYPEPAPRAVFHSCRPPKTRRRITLEELLRQDTAAEELHNQRTEWFLHNYPVPPEKDTE